MFSKISWAIALAFALATTASAQDFDWRTVLNQTTKVQMDINTKYEVSKERQVPVHFSMGVPFAKGALITRTRFPKTEGNVGELMFLSPDEQLLEYVTISTGTVAGSTLEERQKNLFVVIEGQVYPSLTPPEAAKVIGGRKVEIGGHPAVEFLSLFLDPVQGAVAARIVGVISPNGSDVLFFVQQTMRTRMDINDPDELAGTFAGTMLSSLTFEAYRDASGALIEF